jgi:hypothetical protein
MAASSLQKLFQKHTVADLPVPKTLIEIDSKSPLIDGFEVRFLVLGLTQRLSIPHILIYLSLFILHVTLFVPH